jgi:hypothetical protein
MLIWITIAAILAAIVSTIVAWRAVREERRRSAARVATLSREIHAVRFDLDLRPGPSPPASASPAAAIADRPLFADAPSPRPRLGLALAIAGFVAASAGAAAIVLGGGEPTAPRVASVTRDGSRVTSTGAHTPAAVDAPLELVALAHEREGDTLTVHGTIRNPASGLERDHLTAVVFVFDREGGFVASGRAAADSPALIPGGESGFAVAIPDAGRAARYRVSFRAGDRIVSHVDRRSTSGE